MTTKLAAGRKPGLYSAVMRTKRGKSFLLALLLLTAGCGHTYYGRIGGLRESTLKPAIAIEAFEDRSGTPDGDTAGEQIPAFLAEALIRSDRYTVIEKGNFGGLFGELRRRKDKIFGDADAPEAQTAPGHFTLRGIVTDFSHADVTETTRTPARIAFTINLVDTDSGEVLDAIRCAAERRPPRFGPREPARPQVGSDAFFRTPLGKATQKAIRQAVKTLNKTLPRRPWYPMIADVVGGRIVINGGRDRGLRVGQLYAVVGEGHPVTDPMTGQKLSVVPGHVIANLRITEVQEHIAFGTIIQGGDVRRTQRLIPHDARRPLDPTQ